MPIAEQRRCAADRVLTLVVRCGSADLDSSASASIAAALSVRPVRCEQRRVADSWVVAP